jgi:hypothetical protein
MIGGEPWMIVDIGMRMLTPRELFRAQGFPDSYIIDRTADGTPISKTDQIRMCGNSVCRAGPVRHLERRRFSSVSSAIFCASMTSPATSWPSGRKHQPHTLSPLASSSSMFICRPWRMR